MPISSQLPALCTRKKKFSVITSVTASARRNSENRCTWICCDSTPSAADSRKNGIKIFTIRIAPMNNGSNTVVNR